MPSDEQQDETFDDEVLASWTFPEYEQHDRSRKWWYWFGGLATLALLYAIFTANFLFALITIIVSAITIHRHYHGPGDVPIYITHSGIVVGDEAYAWNELKSFWLAYEPPEIKKLFFTFSSRVRPHLTVPLMDENPLAVRELLNEYLNEDLEQESEPTVELLGRVLRL